MALRIVSGVLLPKSDHQDNGSATIELKSNSVPASADATVNNPCEYGGESHYDSEPCKAVSIRYFDGKPTSINLTDNFIIDGGIYKKVKIDWNCVGGKVKEITYFFAGEE